METTTILPSLTIGDFKAFRGINHIELAPLTIVYGPNSSGKSSILQAILMLADTLLLNGDTRGLEQGDRLRLACNSRTDVGGLKNFTHGQGALSRSISLGFQPGETIVPSSYLPGCTLPRILEEISGYQVIIHFSELNSAGSIAANRLDVLYGRSKSRLLSYRLDPSSDALVPDEACLAQYVSWLEEIILLAGDWKTTIQHWKLQHTFGGEALLPWLASRRSDNKLILEPAPWADEDGDSSDPDQHSQSNQMIWLFQEMAFRADELARILFSFNIDARVITRQARPAIRLGTVLFEEGSQKPLELRLSDSQFGVLRGAIRLTTRSTRCSPKQLGISSARMEFMLKTIEKLCPKATAGDSDDVLASLASSLSCFPVPLQFSRNISHIGPLRPQPRRFYSTTSLYSDYPASPPPPEWMKKLLQSSEAEIASCNAWLRRLDIDYSISVIQSSDSVLGDYFTVSLRHLATDTRHSLCDVGFGLSQIIPIITTATLSRSQLLMVEQPELHLHPRLQAELRLIR